MATSIAVAKTHFQTLEEQLEALRGSRVHQRLMEKNEVKLFESKLTFVVDIMPLEHLLPSTLVEGVATWERVPESRAFSSVQNAWRELVTRPQLIFLASAPP